MLVDVYDVIDPQGNGPFDAPVHKMALQLFCPYSSVFQLILKMPKLRALQESIFSHCFHSDFLRNIKVIDTNLFSDGKYKSFEIFGHPKINFPIFSYI